MDRKFMKERFNAVPIPVALLLALIMQTSHAEPQDRGPVVKVEQAPISRDSKAAASFAAVVKRTAPCVVNIFSTLTVREEPNPLLNDPVLRRFFGDDYNESTRPRNRKAEGLGSGVIVSADGYILTASHVIDGAEKVKVALASGEKEFEARIIGSDPATDVAVLKLDIKTNLPAATMADSDKLEVGDIVLAVGNPLGVGQTVTQGIISGLGRNGFGINAYEDFIQTDAAINQGNSGGALVDAEGRLVGINTAIVSRSGGNMGIGFAVPINMSRYVMDRIIKEGKVARGYLGINIQTLTPGLAGKFGFSDQPGGVLIGGIARRGPAELAGVKKGDLLAEIDGKKVNNPRDLSMLVAKTPPGSNVTLRILRSDANRKITERNLTATLGELPQENKLTPTGRGRPTHHSRNRSSKDSLDGVEVIDLDAATQREAAIPSDVHGALVAHVDPDSNAAEAGLRAGEVILEIERHPIQNGSDAVKLSEQAKGDSILLNVWSRPDKDSREDAGGTRYVEVDNTKRE
jgi:serine protease Do